MPGRPFEDPGLTLPCSPDAERAVLGAILIENTALHQAQQSLREGDFYRDDHRRIYRAMAQLSERSAVIDLVTMKEELDRRGELEAAGGVTYLSSLLDGVPKSANIEHYVRILREKAGLRSAMRAAHGLIEAAASRNGAMPGEDLEAVLTSGDALRQALETLARPVPALADLANRLSAPERGTSWAIQDLLEFGAASLGSGAAKIGKSTIAVAGGLALADGAPFAGRLRTDRAPFLWIDGELGERRALPLIRRLARGEGIDAAALARKGLLHYIDATRPGPARDPGGWARLVRERGVGLALIDPAVALFTGDENSAVEVRAWWGATVRPMLDAGAAVLVVHHTRKGLAGIQDDAASSARGSGDWRGAPDLHFDLRRDPLDRRLLRLEITGSRIGVEPEPFLLRLEDHAGGTRVRWAGVPEESAGKTLAAADAIGALVHGAGDGGLHRQQILGALGGKYAERTLVDALRHVRERRQVEVRRVGKTSVYRRREA